ncbi:MAG: FAD:protein FMN transferase [Rhodobacteraceae bacterium]|nr:FAD:protein FMN transferase [Paracoccaceae bacterium]
MTDISTLTGQTMGGLFQLRLPQLQKAAHLLGAVQSILDLVDTQMSGWSDTSDLARINAAPLLNWVPVPKEMAEVVALGLKMADETQGALNICMGHNARVYGHGTNNAPLGGTAPASINPTIALGLDLKNLRIQRRMDVLLDLNSIAKGYSVDLVSAYLKTQGVTDFVLEVAGDIYATGKRPNGMPWTVGLELPLPDKSVPLRFVPLVNCAIATSGNYRRYSSSKNGIAGHVIDPTTGQAMDELYASVTVIAQSSARADALATALFTMGPKTGLAFATQSNIAATFISRSADGFIEQGSPAMFDYLEKQERVGT